MGSEMCIRDSIYVDNLVRLRSDSFRGIAGRGAAIQAVVHDRDDIKSHICDRVGRFKSKCPLRFKHQQQNDGQQPQQREEHQNNPRRQHRGGGRGPVWCSYHQITTIATPTASPGGLNELAATITLLPLGLRESRKSAAPTVLRKRKTSRNAPTSPSQRWRYIPRWQL